MYRKAAQTSFRSLRCERMRLHPIPALKNNSSSFSSFSGFTLQACRYPTASSTPSIQQYRHYSLSNGDSHSSTTASDNAKQPWETTTDSTSSVHDVYFSTHTISDPSEKETSQTEQYLRKTRIKEDWHLSLSEAQMHSERIMKGPAEVARMFLGKELTLKAMAMIRLAEKTVADAAGVESLFHNPSSIIRYGPAWLATLRKGQILDEETLKMIEQGDRLIRNPDNVVRAASSPILRGYPQGMLPNILVDSVVALVGRNEIFLGSDRMPNEYLPDGPYEIATNHVGKPLTPEFGEAMKNAEPRLENGELNPFGPYVALIRPWLIALGLMEPPSVDEYQLEQTLELVSPSTVNDFHFARAAHGEKLLKSIKGVSFEGPIAGGPLSYLTNIRGESMSLGILKGLLQSQKRFLPISQIPKASDGPYFALTPAGNITQRYNLRSAIDSQFGKDTLSISAPSPKEYTILPPTKYFNKRLLSLIEIWERHYRKTVLDAGKFPGDLAASPTILARRFLDHEIDEKMYEAMLEEENKFLGQPYVYGIDNGPASIIRSSQLVIKTPWALEIITEANRGRKTEKTNYENVLERIELTRERADNNSERLEIAKKAVASCQKYLLQMKETNKTNQAEEEDTFTLEKEETAQSDLLKYQETARRLQVAYSAAQVGLARLERSVSEAIALGSLTEKEMTIAARLGFGPDGKVTTLRPQSSSGGGS